MRRFDSDPRLQSSCGVTSAGSEQIERFPSEFLRTARPVFKKKDVLPA